MRFSCHKCDKELTLKHFVHQECRKVLDVDLTKIGLFCTEHADEVESGLKEIRFVEEYKGNKIYSKAGSFIPYWGCNYYFKNIEDVKERIDNPHIGIVDERFLGMLNQG